MILAHGLIFVLASVEIDTAPERQVDDVLNFRGDRHAYNLQMKVIFRQFNECVKMGGTPRRIMSVSVSNFNMQIVEVLCPLYWRRDCDVIFGECGFLLELQQFIQIYV